MNQQTYTEARNELGSIMKELESPNLDVDALDVKVARAAHLIRFCRKRIYQVRLKVDKVVLDLEQEFADEQQKNSEEAIENDDSDIPF
jgi:exodeoxyribonuclease VII small subunit